MSFNTTIKYRYRCKFCPFECLGKGFMKKHIGKEHEDNIMTNLYIREIKKVKKA